MPQAPASSWRRNSCGAIVVKLCVWCQVELASARKRLHPRDVVAPVRRFLASGSQVTRQHVPAQVPSWIGPHRFGGWRESLSARGPAAGRSRVRRKVGSLRHCRRQMERAPPGALADHLPCRIRINDFRIRPISLGLRVTLEAASSMMASLRVGRVGAAADQRTGMPHALARGRGHAGDEAHDGLLHVGLAPARRFWLRQARRSR